MSDSSSASSGGVGFFGLLGIVFIVLKLAGITEVATWSWWWVLAPLWAPITIALCVGLAVLLVFVIVDWMRHVR